MVTPIMQLADDESGAKDTRQHQDVASASATATATAAYVFA